MMCSSGTPARQRIMCGCYTLRAVAAVMAAVAVVIAAMMGAPVVLWAFIAAGLAAVAIVLAARSYGVGGGVRLAWITPPQVEAEPVKAPEEDLEAVRERWLRSELTWPPRSGKDGLGPHRQRPPSTAHLN